jgi:regulator of protease activity HflC (stomatin/prohibitin superfamily)
MRRLLTILLAALTVACVPHTTGATEVGVRTNKVGVFQEKGVQDTVYSPGSTSFFPPMITDWQVFDVALQNLEMSRDVNQGSRQADDSLRFKTIDGNDISVNVTVSWRLAPDRVSYLLRFVGQSTAEIEERLVRPVSRTIIRDVLNELNSEQYYNAEVRFRKASECKKHLDHYLGGEGIIIEQVLLGEHRFNSRYMKVIQDKKVAEQDASRLVSETEAALAQMERELEVARGQVKRAIATADGKAKQQQLQADAIFFERQKQAEALLIEKQALAKGLTERAKALAGSGGRNKVKLAVADALRGKSIVFLPSGGGVDLRTTNMNDLLQLYGVQAVAK